MLSFCVLQLPRYRGATPSAEKNRPKSGLFPPGPGGAPCAASELLVRMIGWTRDRVAARMGCPSTRLYTVRLSDGGTSATWVYLPPQLRAVRLSATRCCTILPASRRKHPKRRRRWLLWRPGEARPSAAAGSRPDDHSAGQRSFVATPCIANSRGRQNIRLENR